MIDILNVKSSFNPNLAKKSWLNLEKIGTRKGKLIYSFHPLWMWILGVAFVKVQKKRAQQDDIIKRAPLKPQMNKSM